MKAWELLEEKGWCQYVYARNSAGIPVRPDNDSACSFCIVGAMEAARVGTAAFLKLGTHMRESGMAPTAFWNDQPERTKAEVVALLKELDI